MCTREGGILVEEGQSFNKRKRIHAHTYREVFTATKKVRTPLLETDFKSKEAMSESGANNLQARCIVEDCSTESYHSRRQPQRMDSEAQSQPSDREATPDQHDSRSPELSKNGSERHSMSTSVKDKCILPGHSKFDNFKAGSLSAKKICIDSSHVEKMCIKRMQQLIMKQKKEIHDFHRDKRERREKLEEEHRLEVDLVTQRYGETRIKEEHLKKLDNMLRERVGEHEHQMDIKRKELDGLQHASRMKLKQMKAKWLANLKKKNMEGSISIVDNEVLFPDFGSQIVQPIKNGFDGTTGILSSTQLSESKHCEETQGEIKKFLQIGDPAVPPEEVAEREVLAVESDGENVASSTSRTILPDSEGDKEFICDAQGNSVPPAILSEKQCQDMKHMMNKQTEEVESHGSDSPKETLRGVLGNQSEILPRKSVGGCLVSDGVNNVTGLALGEALEVAFEPVSNCGNSQNLNGHQVGDSDIETPPRVSGGGTKNRGVDLDVTDASRQKSIENSTEKPTANLACSRCVVVQEHISASSSPLVEQEVSKKRFDAAQINSPETIPVSKSVECGVNNYASTEGSGEGTGRSTEPPCNIPNLCTPNESQLGSLSEERYFESSSNPAKKGVRDEVSDVELSPQPAPGGTVTSGVAPDLGYSSAVSRLLSIEDIVELPPLMAVESSCVFAQPQRCSSSGFSSPLEQSVASADRPCIGLGQTPLAGGVLNCRNSGIWNSLGQGRMQVPLSTSESLYLPIIHSTAVTSSTHSSVAHNQMHASNVVCTRYMQPTNAHLQETSSLRSNVMQYPGAYPLDNELLRIQIEEQEALKIHKEKIMYLKHACEKEIVQMRTQCGLLIQESEIALKKKKDDLESLYARVCANKVLAETMDYCHKQPSSSISQESLLDAVLHLAPRQQAVSEYRNLFTEERIAPPAQVVHQLSELMSMDTSRLQYHAAYQTESSLMGLQSLVAPPHLRRPSPIPPLPTPHISATPDNRQNQQTLVHPHGSLFVPVALVQRNGC